jgi:hypothetical protein
VRKTLVGKDLWMPLAAKACKFSGFAWRWQPIATKHEAD